MSTTPFPDLQGSFQLIEDEDSDQLDAPDPYSLQEAITEQQTRDMHWRLTFKRVQYGTFEGAPACLLVVEAKFHAERIKRHRFTWARIGIEFSGGGSGVEVKRLAPEKAHGVHVPQERASRWAIGATLSISVPGTPLTVDIFNASKEGYEKHRVDLIAAMRGSLRGFPKAREALWTLDEAKGEGVPLTVPSMVVLLRCEPGAGFAAKFAVEAKVNASLNPASWQRIRGVAQVVAFDGRTELRDDDGREVDVDFTGLDIRKLTRLNFADD